MAALIATMSIVFHAPAAPGLFSSLEGFATKTGFRGIFAWQATQPVKAVVNYGQSPEALDSSIITVPGSRDSAGMAIADGLEIGKTYFWQVEDLLTGEKSEIKSFTASNAYNDWNGSTYTLDLLIQLDSQSLPPEIPWDLAAKDIAAGVNIFAERLYDAMDGFARLGKVIITDTETDYAGSVPAAPTVGCEAVPGAGGNLADVLVQTTVPFDSHTFGGWAIDDPCTSFYVGRIGWLVVPWADDLMFGFTAVHEMMHYAFAAPDLYPANSDADCANPEWDGSVLHNTGGWNGKRWELTELDRNPDLTPCDHGTMPYTWQVLRERYQNVPERPNGPIEHMIDRKARGNEDGGALDIKILDRSGPQSSLTGFTPDDTNPPLVPEPDCGDPGAAVTTDQSGDSNFGVSPPESALDVVDARLTWDEPSKSMTFSIQVDDLGEQNPTSAPDISFLFDFRHANEDLYVRASRSVSGIDAFSVGSEPVSGSFNADTDTISITVANEALEALEVKPFATGDVVLPAEIVSVRALNALLVPGGLVADRAAPTCAFSVGTGTTPIPPAPKLPPDVELGSSSLVYSWDGSRSTNVKEEPVLGQELFGCDGFEGPGCEQKRILVADPGLLEVSVEGENPLVNDYDLFLYDPKGKEVDRSAEPGGSEEVSATVTATGIYTVAVHAWLTVDASYKGSAKLTLSEKAGATKPVSAAPGATPSPSPSTAKQKPRPPGQPAPPADEPGISSGPPQAEVQPSFRGPSPAAQAGPQEVPTEGVSSTASLAAAVAALLAGLAAGFVLARRS